MTGVDQNDEGTEFSDLRDLAIREVVHLLDEQEAVRFDRSFNQLSPARQAEILDLQGAVAREINACGDEIPDRALRYKVLARVSEAIEEESAAVEPIATIGRIRGRQPDRSTVPQAVSGSGDQSAARQSWWSFIRSELRWRAAAIVLASALVVLGVIHVRTVETLDKFEGFALREFTLDAVIRNSAEAEAIKTVLDSSTTRYLALESFDQESAAGSTATLAYDFGGHAPDEAVASGQPRSAQAVLMLMNMPTDVGALVFVARNASGEPAILASIGADELGVAGITPVTLEFDESVFDSASSFEIVSAETGELLLSHRRASA